MDLSLITARIIDQVSALSVGDRVMGAAELQAAIANPEQLIKPSAFVVWAGDTALDQSPIPGQQARFREDFAVVLAVDNSLDMRGSAGVARLEPLSEAVKTALVGWAPDSDHLPVYYTGSVHVDMNTERLLHSFNYSSAIPGGSIFSYTVGFRVALLTTADVPTLYALYETQVNAVIGADTRLTSDYLLDREAIPESETRYQLRLVPAGVDGRADTAGSLKEIQVEISVHHHLAPTDSERTYTETTMRTALATLLPPSYWRDSSLTHEVREAPTLSLGADLSRE